MRFREAFLGLALPKICLVISLSQIFLGKMGLFLIVMWELSKSTLEP